MTSRDEDLAHCRHLLAKGSQSFAAAGRVLPRVLRDDAAVVYAFCRVADDLVDGSVEPARGLEEVRARLDAVYEGRGARGPVERALAELVGRTGLPRAPFDAMAEGFRWDVERRRYRSLSDLVAYSVRVAGTVGVLMAHLFGERDRRVLGRAVDLGVGMQLTNIARDVGEDARAGRFYLPLEWCAEIGFDVEAFVAAPRFSPEVGYLVRRLLREADGFYDRADRGVAVLDRSVRVAIGGARRIYAEIGRVIIERGYDTVSVRAATTPARKAWLLGAAALAATRPRGASPTDEPIPEAVELLAAAAPAEASAPGSLRRAGRRPMERRRDP